MPGVCAEFHLGGRCARLELTRTLRTAWSVPGKGKGWGEEEGVNQGRKWLVRDISSSAKGLGQQI